VVSGGVVSGYVVSGGVVSGYVVSGGVVSGVVVGGQVVVSFGGDLVIVPVIFGVVVGG
jgi:hypothetical protein